ncbi:hypothetical protein PRUPE_5G130100 [Prunus persica]|uniref:Uncharacterized protein n=1 Tax=Prunus persica TaxID=3760 RepID=A0A251P7P5_PRUPE|nr:hypothetical protein PRUPE_5G130100 [Prunus persica]
MSILINNIDSVETDHLVLHLVTSDQASFPPIIASNHTDLHLPMLDFCLDHPKIYMPAEQVLDDLLYFFLYVQFTSFVVSVSWWSQLWSCVLYCNLRHSRSVIIQMISLVGL